MSGNHRQIHRQSQWRLGIRTCLAFLVISGTGVFAETQRPSPTSYSDQSFLEQATTSSQRAVYAAFVASTCVPPPCSSGSLDTAITVSNTLSSPSGVAAIMQGQFGDLEGTVEVYFWDTFGHLLFYETGVNAPGFGLAMEPGREGFLVPGATWRVLASEILDRMDYAQHEADFDHADGVFAGYMWVVGNFDGVQGTSNLTDFSTFTQSLVLQPGMDRQAEAGIPLFPPSGSP